MTILTEIQRIIIKGGYADFSDDITLDKVLKKDLEIERDDFLVILKHIYENYDKNIYSKYDLDWFDNYDVVTVGDIIEYLGSIGYER